MLTDKAIKAAKPREKPYKLADGLGLYLEVTPNGSRLWRWKYRYEGKEKRLAFGGYPDIPGTLARQRRDDARKLLATGIDPSAARQASKQAAANSFELVALEWLVLQQKKLAPATYAKAEWTLKTLVFPFIGSRPIDKLRASDVLKLLKRIEARGLHETAHRTRQRCSQVFRYAVQTERAERDVTADLRGALAAVVSTNHASIKDPAKISQLLRDIEAYRGHAVTWYALRLAVCIRQARRAASCGVVGVRLGRRAAAMANPCRENENARAACRAAITAGSEAAKGVASHHRHRQVSVPGNPRHGKTDQ